MNQPHVSIIILNWNGLEDTIKCLESLKNITYDNYKIIVVDNASQGNDVKILREKFDNYIDIIENSKNYGYAEGNNIGIRYALESNTDYILILNNDIIVDSIFLDELIDVSENNPKIGLVGPKTYYMDRPDVLFSTGGKLMKYIGQHWMIGNKQKDVGQFDKNSEVDFIAGACLLLKRDVIEDVGLIPDEFFMQWEDIDYCIQIRKKGYICMYAYSSKIWHKVGASFDRYNQNYLTVSRGIKNRFIFSKKNSSKIQLIIFLILFTSITMPIYISYYLFIYRDIKRVYYFYLGYSEGVKYILAHNNS